MVELRVVQAVEQVDRARTGRGHAHAEPAGELRVADRLERAHLLVPRLDELRLVLGAAPGREDAVDAVARVGEHVLDPPVRSRSSRWSATFWSDIETPPQAERV